jgi:hypothetical protein
VWRQANPDKKKYHCRHSRRLNVSAWKMPECTLVATNVKQSYWNCLRLPISYADEAYIHVHVSIVLHGGTMSLLLRLRGMVSVSPMVQHSYH